jgi:hypothetical protein
LIVNNSRIALDIDDPDDLRALLEIGGSANTLSLIKELQVAERIASLTRETTARA